MDASGHLGSALVHMLLQRGYTVHAALQHPEAEGYLLSLLTHLRIHICMPN